MSSTCIRTCTYKYGPNTDPVGVGGHCPTSTDCMYLGTYYAFETRTYTIPNPYWRYSYICCIYVRLYILLCICTSKCVFVCAYRTLHAMRINAAHLDGNTEFITNLRYHKKAEAVQKHNQRFTYVTLVFLFYACSPGL